MNQQIDVYDVLSSLPHNERYLNRYLNFIKKCLEIKSNDEYYEKHHICPKSLFPQYKKLSIYKWNLAKLTGRQHFIAHMMLAKVFPGKMSFCLFKIAYQCGIEINSSKYEYIRKIISSECSQRSKDSIWWINKETGETKFCKQKPHGNYIKGRGQSSTKNKVGYVNYETYQMIYIDPNDEPPTGFIKGSLKNNQSLWFNTITQRSEYFNNDVIPDTNIYIKGSPNSATWRLQNIKTGEIIYSKTKHVEGYEHKPFGKDKVWVNNGKTSMLVYENEIPEGWTQGALHQVGIKRTAGRKWYHCPLTKKSGMFHGESIPDGWIKGRY